MMFCSQCGSEQSEGARFCSRCGQGLAVGTAISTPRSASVQLPAYPLETVAPRLRTNLPDFVKQALHPSELVLAAYSASLLDHHRRGQFRHDKFVLTDERIIYFHT